ncbi:MAG TPA: two-component regulator propeller domain-containing protein [Parafilimonas sp.]|nr:two-component regulator propeller domain-containing protein [Parafilimonas sp.]
MKPGVLKYISATYLFLLSTCFIYAQSFAFSHYKLVRGLPANVLMQDHKGFIWVGSDGLFKFDGINSTYFYNDPKIKGSLVNNGIKSLAEDVDGTIWAGTLNGISHYDPSSNSFTNYIHKEGDTTSLVTNYDNIVFVDDEGNVWAGNREGISKFNRQQQTFAHYNIVPYQQRGRLRGKFITCIINDKANKEWLWLSSYDGLIHFRKKDGYAVYYYPFDKPVTLTKILMDSHQRLWICTWGSGLGLFNQQTKIFSFRLFENDRQMGTTNIIFSLKEKPVGITKSIFYASTDLGLTSFIIEANDTSPVTLQHFLVADPSDIKSIGGHPNDILIDKQNIVWIATSTDLSYILPNNQVFINHRANNPPFGAINTITEDKDETGKTFYWISSWYADGLLRCDSTCSAAQKVNYFNRLAHSKDALQINQTLPVQQQLWVATMDGLFLYDKQTKKSNAFHQNDKDSLLPSDRIYALCADHLNRLWIGTYNNGFAVMDMRTQKKVTLNNELLHECAGKKASAIFEDSKGFVWMNNADELLKVNTNNFQFSVYRHIAGDLHSIAGSVTQITEDTGHHIWISTREGLCVYSEANNNFNLFTTSDGLSNNDIESIACDGYNNLWIATAKGLNRLDLKTFRIKAYYNEDGIESDAELNYLLNCDGKIVIGGDNFITMLNPLSLTRNNTAPPVYINSLRLNNKNKTIVIYDSLSRNIKLPYDENYFTIDFIALNFINAAQNKYAFQLEGIDKKFIQAGNMHQAVYTNVAPGTYTFNIKASNNDDVWNDAGASITIQIEPPFWKTWWFITGCIILCMLAVYGIYRYRINQLLRVERLRSKISTDLHDDIGSTLSSISILSDMVLRRKDDDNALSMLQEIKDNSIDLMERMDDIVWSINPKNDTFENLMLRIKRFASHLFEAAGVEYSIHITDNVTQIKLPMEKRQHLYLIIKESINNIIKHAGCSHASITATYKNGEFVVEVKDNGNGFDTSKVYHGNGLLSLQQRAALMQAQLKIQSAKDAGTTVTVKTKIK